MAAVLELEPTSSRRYVSLEDPRTFSVAVTRQRWRELPFELITGETLVVDGPSLVFFDRRLPRVVELQLLLAKWHERYCRTHDGVRRSQCAMQIRRLHLRIVNLACGYTWPGNPPGHIEFAE